MAQRSILILVLASFPLRVAQSIPRILFPPPPPSPPRGPPPPSPPAPPSNTTLSFFNVAACSVMQAIELQFPDEARSGSAGQLSCPLEFRVFNPPRCKLFLRYGRELYVTLAGDVPYLDISIINPNDGSQLRAPTRVYLSIQRRNHIGAAISQGSVAGCTSRFQVINELGLGEIEPGNCRTIFRHAAIGVGASAQIIANGESIVTTVSAGTSIKIEQRLLTLSDIPSPVGITFATPTSGIAAEPSPPTDLWGTTCEMATTAFYLIGSPADNLPLQVLRAPRRCLIASNCL